MNNFEENDSVSSRFNTALPYGRLKKVSSPEDMNMEKILNPWATYSRFWSKIFLASCVIGVSVDPLFLYIPIIQEEKKCLAKDENMKIVAVVLRTLTDFTYVLHLIFRLKSALAMAKLLGSSIYIGFPWSYLLIDILAILPIPQVIILNFFSMIAGSRSFTGRKFLDILLLLQYVPRILRVYLSARDLGRNFDSLTRLVWVKGAFNLFLYLIVGHVFGALWYFHSFLRETACWHHAFTDNTDYRGCNHSLFDCHGSSIKNLTCLIHLTKFCPVDPPNSEFFDFGIFTDAIKSRILYTKDFLRKFSRSFWWGLQNLSSFGQNLDTSSNIEENFFAVLISILGLLLFLYLVGNLQTYMQLATTKSEATRKKVGIKQPEIESYLSDHNLPDNKKRVIMRYLQGIIKDDKDFDVKYLFSLLQEHMEAKHKFQTFAEWITKLMDVKKHERGIMEQKAELWILKNEISDDLRPKIMRYVRLRLQETKAEDVGSGNILPILPLALLMAVKKHICLPLLKKVPMLQSMDEDVHETICNFLKPVTFGQSSYIIRKGEPLDFILFITQGIVWTFGSSTSPMARLQKGDYYGEELVEWRLSSTSYSEFPISTANLKSHTKVEAFALMAIDMEHVLSSRWSKFSQMYSTDEYMPEGLKPFAVASMEQLVIRRRNIQKKRTKDNPRQSGHLSIEMR